MNALCKRCPGCGLTKAITAFWRNRSHRDRFGGRQAYCKPCAHAAHKLSLWKHGLRAA